MADADSNENPIGITVKGIADRVVEEWITEYQKDPGFYSKIIVSAIKQSIQDEVQRAASDVIRDKHSPNIGALMARCIEEWIVRGDIEITPPSDEVVSAIGEVLSTLAVDGKYQARQTAHQKKISVYRLRAVGVPFKDIANRIGVSQSTAREIFDRAQMDIESFKKTLAEYEGAEPANVG